MVIMGCDEKGAVTIVVTIGRNDLEVTLTPNWEENILAVRCPDDMIIERI